MASATLIKRFAKRDRRIGSGVEEGIFFWEFRASDDQEQGCTPASTLTRSTTAARRTRRDQRRPFRWSKRVEGWCRYLMNK